MFLFDQLIFGPIHSRRLGLSLGINLLPTDAKICSFNCVYCECGFNTTMKDSPIPTRQQVYEQLEAKLAEMTANNQIPDVITFAGNGEPTLHTEFDGIIDDTIALRNQYCPSAKVSVLSNSTRLHNPKVFAALRKVDNNILKFDSAIDHTIKLINDPTAANLTVEWFLNQFARFNGQLIIQTMFLRGIIQGQQVDNTSENELQAWIDAILKINPKQVMIYSLDREAPTTTIQKIPVEELNRIADRLRLRGIDVSVAG